MVFLKLYPIVMVAVLWGSEWSKKRIISQTDINKSVTQILKRGRSRRSNIMLLLGVQQIITFALNQSLSKELITV